MKTKFKSYLILAALAGPTLLATAQEVKLSLNDALQIAKQHNRSLKVQAFQKEIAEESVRDARGNVLPSLTAYGSYTRFFDRQVIFMPGSFVGNEVKPIVDVAVGGRNAFTANLVLHQPLLNEGARRQIHSAKLNSTMEGLQGRNMGQQLIVEVLTTYYSIQLLNESIALHEQSLQRNEQALNDSRQLLRQGKNLKVDTLRNYIETENVRSSILYLKNQEEVAELQLKNQLGIPHEAVIQLTDELMEDTNQHYFNAVENSFAESLSGRSDIQLKKVSTEYSRSVLKQSRAQRIPTVSFVASYQLQAQANNLAFAEYAWPRTSFIGLQAKMPVFSGNQINARINQAKLRMQQQELEVQQLYDLAKTEVVAIQSQLKEAIRQAALRKRTVDAAELSYAMTSDRYRNGLSSRLELTDAELALTQAKLLQLQSYYQLKVTALEYQRALGLLEP
jgi:outer membrane protein